MEKKFKHLKTFESYGSEENYKENPMGKEEMVSMLDQDKSCDYTKEELMKMSNKELEEMCSGLNEGFFDWFVDLINNMDKGGKAKDFLEEMPGKINSLIRVGKKGDKRGLDGQPSEEEIKRATQEADKDGYLGKLSAKDGKLVYISSKDAKSRSKTTTSI